MFDLFPFVTAPAALKGIYMSFFEGDRYREITAVIDHADEIFLGIDDEL